MAFQFRPVAAVSALRDCFQQGLDGAQAPRDEARGLFVLIRSNAASVESVRDLIAVPPKIEGVLLLYAKEYPEDARGIEKMIGFRKRVLSEFDRLVRRSLTKEAQPSGPGADLEQCVVRPARELSRT
jgi:hypothetical protein